MPTETTDANFLLDYIKYTGHMCQEPKCMCISIDSVRPYLGICPNKIILSIEKTVR